MSVHTEPKTAACEKQMIQDKSITELYCMHHVFVFKVICIELASALFSTEFCTLHIFIVHTNTLTHMLDLMF